MMDFLLHVQLILCARKCLLEEPAIFMYTRPDVHGSMVYIVRVRAPHVKRPKFR